MQEYPDLQGKDDTRKELLSRVDILNRQLWEIVLARKNEALEKRASMMTGGWAAREEIEMMHIVAGLMDQEAKRFNSCVTTVTGFVFNEEMDL